MNAMDRRGFLRLAGTAVAAAAAPWPLPAGASAPRKIAALATTYHVRSHADNFITRFLEGYWINDRYYPAPCRVASLYVEQEHPADIGARLAASWGVARYPTIREALTLGGDTLAVDGVLLIAEHGDYPPTSRTRSSTPATNTWRRSSRSSAIRAGPCRSSTTSSSPTTGSSPGRWSTGPGSWIPFMAGSSVSVTFRRPELDFPLETPLEEAMAVGGGWVADGGLFHLLETLQCFAERRKGGETGVKAVQLLADDAVWKAADEGRFSRALLEAALTRGSKVTPGPVEEKAPQPVACLVEYNDGFRGSALALGGKAAEYLAAVRIEGQPAPLSTLCYIPIENSNNFSPLVDSIGRMFTRGTLDYPVERTLLTSGALSFLMESWHRGQVRIETPMLEHRLPSARSLLLCPRPGVLR